MKKEIRIFGFLLSQKRAVLPQQNEGLHPVAKTS
jgi:hypothetical protein